MIPVNKIGLNALQRRTANVALNTRLPVQAFVANFGEITMIALTLTADLMVKNKTRAKQVRDPHGTQEEKKGGGGGRGEYISGCRFFLKVFNVFSTRCQPGVAMK